MEEQNRKPNRYQYKYNSLYCLLVFYYNNYYKSRYVIGDIEQVEIPLKLRPLNLNFYNPVWMGITDYKFYLEPGYEATEDDKRRFMEACCNSCY